MDMYMCKTGLCVKGNVQIAMMCKEPETVSD